MENARFGIQAAQQRQPMEPGDLKVVLSGETDGIIFRNCIFEMGIGGSGYILTGGRSERLPVMRRIERAQELAAMGVHEITPERR